MGQTSSGWAASCYQATNICILQGGQVMCSKFYLPVQSQPTFEPPGNTPPLKTGVTRTYGQERSMIQTKARTCSSIYRCVFFVTCPAYCETKCLSGSSSQNPVAHRWSVGGLSKAGSWSSTRSSQIHLQTLWRRRASSLGYLHSGISQGISPRT